MPVDLRARQGDWLALRRHFASSFRTRDADEIGAIGLISEAHRGDRDEYLLVEVIWPEAGDVVERGGEGLVFASSYLRRAHMQMRDSGLVGICTFHTHPLADDRVTFSPFDNAQDPDLVANLQELAPTTKLLSVVIGKTSQHARIWRSPRNFEPLRQLIIVGERLLSLALRMYKPVAG